MGTPTEVPVPRKVKVREPGIGFLDSMLDDTSVGLKGSPVFCSLESIVTKGQYSKTRMLPWTKEKRRFLGTKPPSAGWQTYSDRTPNQSGSGLIPPYRFLNMNGPITSTHSI